MANAQKITEIIDEKAFQQWAQFVDSLELGQAGMAKVLSLANEMNKTIGASKSMADFSKNAEKAALEMEKLAQAQARTKILNERAAQAELKTIEMTERRAKKEAEAALAAEKNAKAAERASAQFEINARKEEQALSSVYDANMKVAQSQKDIEKGLKANEAASRELGDQIKQTANENAAATEEQRTAYINYRGTLDQLIRQNIEYKKELSDLKIEQKALGDTVPLSKMVQFEKETRELQAAIQANNTEIRRMVKENVSAEGSMDAVEAQLNSLRTAYRALSREERETSEEAAKLLAEIQKLDAEFKEQKKSIGQHQDEVGNYALIWDQVPGPIRRVVDALNEANDSQGRLTFGSLINGLKALTAQAWAFVATPVGATIAAIAAVVGGAKLWFDYNRGLQEATKLTQDLTDTTGNATRVIRDMAMATSETFDKEFNETLRSANTLASEFGLTYEEAIDKINNGFIRGADNSGQFLDNVREYSSQMRSAGISADEMVAILIRSEKEGVFSDKGIDAIKEGTLRIREMTESTQTALKGIGIDSQKLQKDLISGQVTMFEAIQMVSTEMSKFSDNSSEVGRVLADVFGGPGEDAGIRYLKMLGDINLEQEISLDTMSDIERAQLMQLKATEELNKEWSNLFDATGGGFELMIAQFKVIVTDWLVKLIRGIRNLYNWFVDLYNESIVFRGVIQTIPLYFGQIINAAKLMFDYLISGWKATGNAIKAILTGNFSDLSDIWSEFTDNVSNDTKKFVASTNNALATAVNNTVNGRATRLDDYDDTGTSAGTAPGQTGTGGTVTTPKGSDSAIKKALKAREEMERRMLQLTVARAEAEKRVADDLAEYNLRIINDENNAFEDRFNNLTDFNSNRSQSIELQKKVELAQLEALKTEAVKLQREGKIEEYNAQLEIIDLKTQEIESKEVEAQRQLQETIKKTTLQLLRERYGEELDLTLTSIDQRIQEEQKLLAERYAQGLLNEREYANERLAIQNKATTDLIQEEIKQLEAFIELGKEKGVETRDAEKELANLKIELSKEATDQQIEDLERLVEAEKAAADRRKEIAQDIADASFELLDTIFERKIGDIEKDIELNEEERERELEQIEQDNLTEEEKALKTYAVQQKYQQKEQELERKKIEMQRKQAKFQKAQAVLQIGLATAQGIARAFADFPFPVAAGIAIGVGVLGAIQLAAALAAPLPQYFTGTDSSKGGLAHVGERGSELYVTPSGTIGMTPPRDTIMNLEEGTKIFNANETRRLMAGARDNESAIVGRLLEENTSSNRKLLKAIENNEVHSTLITKDGWRKQHNKISDFKKYLRSNGIQ